jgi:AraC-like DNA-binding protein
VKEVMSDFLRIDNLTELFRIMGLPSPRHPLTDIVDFEKTPLNINMPDVKVICGFYLLSFKGGGSGSLKYGRESYDFQEGSLIYVAPEQVVEYGELNDVKIDTNWTLFFHPDLLLASPLNGKMKEYDFFDYSSHEALHISEQEKRVLESIIYKIDLELDSHLDDYSEELILNNLESLLNYSKRFYHRQFITRNRFSSDTITRFESLLKNYFEKDLQLELGLPTIQYFADNLNYSPNYLSAVIKKGTDKSILGLIHLELIRIAKIQLLNSDKTVSEIAFDLGFEYSQYFSRLFKSKTGMTPVEFRTA